MTNEEKKAIEILEEFRTRNLNFLNVTTLKAMDIVVKALEQTRWIPASEGLPQLDEEACSDSVLVSLRATTWDISKCQMVHITKIAYYDKYAISSDGRYMDTEGWVLADRRTLSMNEVIAWMPLPQSYKEEQDGRNNNVNDC